jgi:hypothetical protein
MPSYDVTCAGCGEDFQAGSPQAKWCSAGCKKRAQRNPQPEVESPPPEAAPVDSGLVDSVHNELAEAGVADTFAGQLALQLARKMSAVDATGVAALSKELRLVMIEALADGKPSEPAPEEVDDEVALARKAREAKAAAAAGS